MQPEWSQIRPYKMSGRSGPKLYVFNSHLMPIYMNRSRNGITFKFLPFIYITFVLGAQKNRLIETVIFRAHNICLG